MNEIAEAHGYMHSFRCDSCGELIRHGSINALLEHLLYHQTLDTAKLDRLETMMTESLTDQQHIEQDVTAVRAAVTDAVTELKAQIAAGVPAEQLDFTSFDKLVTDEQAEAVADAPPVAAPPVITGDTSSADLPGAATTDAGLGTDAPVDSQSEINNPIGGVGSPAGATVPAGQGDDTTVPVTADPLPETETASTTDGTPDASSGEQPSGDAEPVAEPETPMVGGS